MLFHLSISVIWRYAQICVRWMDSMSCGQVSFYGNRYQVTSCSSDGFWAWTFNPSTDPHRSLLWWQEGRRRSQNLLIARGPGQSPACESSRAVCLSLCAFHKFVPLIKTHIQNNDEEAILGEFCLHKHTCVPFISDTGAGHFTADLGYTFQTKKKKKKRSLGAGSVHVKFLWRHTRTKIPMNVNTQYVL